jgi:hypothetical protein
MFSGNRPILSILLVALFFTSTASAAVSTWAGPSTLSGQSKTVDDAFMVPGNATVIDAWLHVDETGAVDDGTGVTWTGEDIPGNFSLGQYDNSLMGKFDGALSLAPDSAVSNVDSFNTATLQLASQWSSSGNIWGAVNPSGMGGNVSGNNRVMSYGTVPASAPNGGVVAATLAGQALPVGSSGHLTSSATQIPSPISDFNLTLDLWHHLDTADGFWVEYKLDNGQWNWIAPIGGYPDTISTNASVPNGANGTGFGVYGDGNYSGWINPKFSLDNLTGLSSASTIKFRFKVWTDSVSTPRPGAFIDSIYLTNVGSPEGTWHHGCLVSAGTCQYANSANSAITTASIDLSSASSTVAVNFEANWDIEGSTYDNWWAEASTDGQNWDDITTGAMTYSSTWGTSGVPGDGITYNGNSYTDDSGGFVTFNLDLPTSYQGDSSIWVRFRVETDYIIGYGGSADTREGATFDNLTLTDSSGTVYYSNYFSNSTTMSPAATGGVNDWQFPGAGTLTVFESFEDSPALPPGGWSLSNTAGQVGWEFGAICSNSTSGPSSFTSASLGFATNLCGDYDANSDNSLISPNYYIPVGASARFIWEQWMCSEDGYDGGSLYISVNGGAWNQAIVSTGNGTNWYDGQITYGTFAGTDVWDGRQHQATTFSCSSVPWDSMQYDVSNLSGNNVSFKFRQMSDSSVEEEGWYVDDVGLEVDWFHKTGSWKSPQLSTHDLGHGFIDAEIILPNATWYGVSILDGQGNTIDGHSNLSMPLSLASIDRDQYPTIQIELHLGTEDEYYSPLIKELTVGATRYFGDGNGWNIPAYIQRNSTGEWVNTGGLTQVVTGVSGHSTRPIGSAYVDGNFSSITARLYTSQQSNVVATNVGTTLNLGGMRGQISPSVEFAPMSSLSSLVFRGQFVQPAHSAEIDVSDDGVIDWEFISDPAYGSYGWQTRLHDSVINHSQTFNVNGGNSVIMKSLVPENAIPHTLVLGMNTGSSADSIEISSGGNILATLPGNWSTTSLHIEVNSLYYSSVISDSYGRNWSIVEIEFSSPTIGTYTDFTVGSFAIGYTLFENVSGLGSVVKAYHDLNSNNGLENIVDIPLIWTAVAGGVGINGGVYHENMITNHPFSVPETWFPTGIDQGFITQHHHLIDNDDISEVHLTGIDSYGDQVKIILSDLSNGGVFTQTDGFGMLKLSNSSTLTEINGRWNIDWQFEVDWDWNDSALMSWTAQGFDAVGEGLSPATDFSGGAGTQASENDLQVDSWNVVDMYGHTLSDSFSPSYPFWAKAGSLVSVSGTVRFENTLDLRPLQEDFVVAISVGDNDVVLNSTGDGEWTGLVTVPTNMSNFSLVPYVLRAGPVTGASGAVDVTLQNPVEVLIDDEAPWVKDLQVNNGQRLINADGYTWDPAYSLSLQVTITDAQALGDSIQIHTWREGLDDTDGDGFADYDEYSSISENLPSGIAGERTVTFSGIDVSNMDVNAKFSIYFTSVDYSGHELVSGGMPGLDSDMATMVIAVNEPTVISTSSLSLNTVSEQLLAGQNHTLYMEISDANGVDSIDVVTVKLLGAEEDEVGVMVWEPRNGAIYTPELSQLTLQEINVTQESDIAYVEFKFKLDWDFDESILSEYSMPAIVVHDDDDLNPVALLTNLGQIRWQLDNDLEVLTTNMVDETPPISDSNSEIIYVRSGDDLTFSGIVQYAKSGSSIAELPPQGLEVTVQTQYGSEPISAFAEVTADGTWSTGMLLPQRPLLGGNLVVEYTLEGVISPGLDATVEETNVIVDDKSPVVQYTSVPLVFDDEDIQALSFAIAILEDGGMPAGDLTVNWAFMRNNLILQDGDSSGIIPYISENAGTWSYAGSVDFSEGINITLQEGDELIWWIDVTDLAGNQASGTGLSMFDPMAPSFTVLSFDVTVTNIEIGLANGTTPRGGQVVEGSELGVTVHLRNIGTKPGEIKVQLLEDPMDGRTWISHGVAELNLYPGQTLPAVTLYYETHGSGPQNLAINITQMDRWVDNNMLPHCYGENSTASCDLDVESDMPKVISQEEANSGISGMGIAISIMAFLLIAAGIAIAILMRRGNDSESMYYDDDEDWEDEEDVSTKYERTSRILPPMAPERPDMDAANSVLDGDNNTNEVEDVTGQENVVESTDNIEDPWADVDHSEEE